jgi:hypothetical protein
VSTGWKFAWRFTNCVFSGNKGRQYNRAHKSVKTNTANTVKGKAAFVLATKAYGGSKLEDPPILASTPGRGKWSGSSLGHFTRRSQGISWP